MIVPYLTFFAFKHFCSFLFSFFFFDIATTPMRATVCDTRWEIVKNVLVSVKRQMVQRGGRSVVNTA